MKKLQEWLNPQYLDTKTVQQMKQAYLQAAFNSLRLYHFFDEKQFVDLEKKMIKIKGKQVKVADRYSYTELGVPKEIKSFFTSKEFLSLMSYITGKKFKQSSIVAKRYSHKDYTLLHDSEELKPGFEFWFDINPSWNPIWGGSLIYRDTTQELFRVDPKANSFTLVNRTKGMQRFLKYVNHRVGNNTMIIIEGKLV